MAIPPTAITSEMVDFPGESGKVPAYLSIPKEAGVRPGVLVIHAIFGLVDHTKDVADRFAREGYVALAPNLFGSPELASVLTPSNIQKAMRLMFRLPRRDPVLAREEIAKLPAEERAIVGPTVERLLGGLPKERLSQDLVAGAAYLRTLPFVRADRIGCIGFCFGGGMSLSLACEGGIQGCAAFYGENPEPIARVQKIDGATLGVYGGDDSRVNADIDKPVKAMAEYKKDFEMRIYPGAAHDFFNDRNPTTYREAAAKEAWDRVLRFYQRTLTA